MFAQALDSIVSFFGFMDPVEVLAAVFGFVCVVLTLRRNIWCWPTGLVQVSLYIWVFWKAKLYSDMGLHVVYVLMSFYGWWHWLRGGLDKGRVRVERLTRPGALFWLVLAGAGTAGLGLLMATRTDAALPYWDAATTVLSLIAQWLMARKVLESWLYWITVDVLAVGIYAVKGLYPSSLLYGTFLVLASLGFFAWLKSLREQGTSETDQAVLERA